MTRRPQKTPHLSRLSPLAVVSIFNVKFYYDSLAFWHLLSDKRALSYLVNNEDKAGVRCDFKHVREVLFKESLEFNSKGMKVSKFSYLHNENDAYHNGDDHGEAEKSIKDHFSYKDVLLDLGKVNQDIGNQGSSTNLTKHESRQQAKIVLSRFKDNGDHSSEKPDLFTDKYNEKSPQINTSTCPSPSFNHKGLESPNLRTLIRSFIDGTNVKINNDFEEKTQGNQGLFLHSKDTNQSYKNNGDPCSNYLDAQIIGSTKQNQGQNILSKSWYENTSDSPNHFKWSKEGFFRSCTGKKRIDKDEGKGILR